MKPWVFPLLAALMLITCATLRAPEYDEAYSIFLTAGDARPAWPTTVFTPASVQTLYRGSPSFTQIAQNLRTGDVHPPLYFWLLKIWRQMFGPSWLAARLLSVVLSLAALGLVARLAQSAGLPLLPALCLTLLSYGFAYTSSIARGFALAQFLDLLGICLLFRLRQRRGAFAGGLAFGAASFTNYLAVFTAGAALLWLGLSRKRWRYLLPAATGLALFLPFDAWFYLGQYASRTKQFAAFSPHHALALLAKDSGAALFGGLPVYAGRFGPLVAILLAALTLFCAAYVVRLRHRHASLFALAAAAPPCGLLALGLVFHNTPIEIRYLAFSLPYVALLLAPALPDALLATVLAVQACAIAGLAFAPATMQPQALAAAAAAPDTLVLLPFGNDGVGIPGPFIAAAPPNMRILLLHPGAMPNLADAPNITLATIRADNASAETTAQALAYFAAQKCFKTTSETALTAQILNRCADQQP